MDLLAQLFPLTWSLPSSPASLFPSLSPCVLLDLCRIYLLKHPSLPYSNSFAIGCKMIFEACDSLQKGLWCAVCSALGCACLWQSTLFQNTSAMIHYMCIFLSTSCLTYICDRDVCPQAHIFFLVLVAFGLYELYKCANIRIYITQPLFLFMVIMRTA